VVVYHNQIGKKQKEELKKCIKKYQRMLSFFKNCRQHIIDNALYFHDKWKKCKKRLDKHKIGIILLLTTTNKRRPK